jgi:uncharacterized membrane protein YeiH
MPLIDVLNWASTVVFALSGVLAVRDAGLDLFGVIVVACATALGGGTLCDLLLGQPAGWLTAPGPLLASAASALLGFRFLGLDRASTSKLLLVLDAIGLSVFTVLGTGKGLAHGVAWPGCLVMGMLTGAGGGMLRDVLAARLPLVLSTEIYATAALLGAAFVLLVPGETGLWLGMAACLALRLAAIRWNLSLPVMTPRQ